MKDWKKFEIAVADFIRALAPDAKVTHDKKIPDKDTGKPRQRDIWIEAKVCNLFPIRILISCKRKKRKLSEDDIDAFIGELRSSGAQFGVVYSYGGFSGPAVDKAKAVGIECCTLYQNEPPELPAAVFVNFFCFTVALRAQINALAFNEWGHLTLADVFPRLTLSNIDLLTSLSSKFEAATAAAIQSYPKDRDASKTWEVVSQISEAGKQTPLQVKLIGRWKIYKAKLEAYLVDGTYSFTDDAFIGTLTAPAIDMRGPEPGNGWERVSAQDVPRNKSSFVFLDGGDTSAVLMSELGGIFIKDKKTTGD